MEVVRHMNIPVFEGERIVAVAGVGNKETEYDESDVRQLTLLMVGMWRLLQRKQAEDRLRHTTEALRRSEAYLAEAQRLSHTGSWAFDLASDKYVYLSQECFRIFELDAQEGLPTREAVSRLIHPEDWDKVKGDFEKLLREKVDTSSEFRIALPSGAAKHIQVIWHPVLNSAGDVVQFVGTVIDITERKRAEEALRRIETYLAEAQRLTHTGSWARSPGGEHYDYWSEETFRIWGFDPQQPRPTYSSLADRVHPEDRDRVLEIFETAQREKKTMISN